MVEVLEETVEVMQGDADDTHTECLWILGEKALKQIIHQVLKHQEIL